jgi:nucleotide-binding universal stress UspA family protein
MTPSAPTTETALRRILVGLDGSRGSERALAWATARAGETGASIVGVHVLTYSKELYRDLPPTGITRWRHDLEDQLRGPWTEPARQAGVGLELVLVEDDSPAAGLIKTADRQHVDLVVVGAHGEGGIADRLLGSTSYKLAHRAHQPVVVIPPGWGTPVAA